jgi:hypothetical protein
MRRRTFILTACLTPALAFAARPFVFVIHPYDTPSRIYSRFRPLTLYLAGVLERPVQLLIASTYDEQITMIADGRADLAYLGPTPYIQARNRAPIRIPKKLRLAIWGQVSPATANCAAKARISSGTPTKNSITRKPMSPVQACPVWDITVF